MTTATKAYTFDPSRYYYLVGYRGGGSNYLFDAYLTPNKASRRTDPVATRLPKDQCPETYVVYDYGLPNKSPQYLNPPTTSSDVSRTIPTNFLNLAS